ncbi:helix-turn-helix domain-containing protein [Flavobacterium olei]|uniref:helix-turn-helix domain-containing protein n=1 Tax=Flavobacterium olei TaxID=1886782 RepID=UPI00321B663F
MVNIDDFVKRLELVLDYYGLNASAFADKIGVQRSSMSHLLSGRNKPSLDFVLKILEVFPEVDLYWMLLGKGSFPKNNNQAIPEDIKASTPFSSNQNLKENSNQDLFSLGEINGEEVEEKKKSPEVLKSSLILGNDEIEKIVLLYKNGTFKTYSP